MVPISIDIHISLLHKFTKCVLWLKNKTHKPTTELTVDIFFAKDLPCKDLSLGNYTLCYFNPIVSVHRQSLCDRPKTTIAIVSAVFGSPYLAGFVGVFLWLAISTAGT
ncbi:hypothetical protein QUB56_30760 [Microcoleus sp. AR_TQ3_B6]|uniref:hypothetical protein n=1 Tax=Microcoleus sp. AR_TQ3_B6 TaxID=3055284 RepID=UPI002FD19DB9